VSVVRFRPWAPTSMAAMSADHWPASSARAVIRSSASPALRDGAAAVPGRPAADV